MANRLQDAKSPYLLAHADNPVDWYPWSAEAFERAQAEDKPILLSIGYSACHWCHTMAEESFSDDATAKIINRNFIPVKVDREERPDVDAVYMRVCRSLTGSGGWPLHLLLTPSKKPFFAGTYYPPEDCGGIIGFKTLLQNAADAWSYRRQAVVDTAGKITDVLGRAQDSLYSQPIPSNACDRAANQLALEFDKENGGFGDAPKFPMPHLCMFLLEYGRQYASANSRAMAEKTLQKIHDGGLHDHVGGGYFRYATDMRWQKPHYEKMLYDNAMLSIAFLEAGGSFLPYAAETLHFLETTLKSENGGFYSAVSATSSQGEGKYYLWNAEEVREALGKDARSFCRTFHISKESLPYVEREDILPYKENLALLHALRKKRPAPPLDRKILTGWNALAAVAFAKASVLLNNPAFLDTAKNILYFINTALRDHDGRLLSRYYEGESGIYAFSEDYAYLMWAQLSLYEATNDTAYLTNAKETWADVIRLFWDTRGGAYFNAADAEQLIFRLMEGEDNAIPSANAVFALCVGKLFTATGDTHYKDDMEKILNAFGSQVDSQPTAFCFLLYAKLQNA